MMRFNAKNWVVFVFLAVLVSACSRFGAFTAPVPGILAPMGSGLLGSSISALSNADKKQALMAEYKAIEYNKAGQAVSWHSRQGQASGTVIPGRPYRVGTQDCRQYSHNWIINGVPYMARGSACRNADGSWTPLQ